MTSSRPRAGVRDGARPASAGTMAAAGSGSSAPAPPRRLGSGSSNALLAHARTVLAEAAVTLEDGERFRLAHLSALRTAAAVIADRGKPSGGRPRLISAWVLIETVAPEYTDWATYFASGAPTRAAVEAGALSAVSARDADDQLRAAQDFLHLVEAGLGLLAAPLAS